MQNYQEIILKDEEYLHSLVADLAAAKKTIDIEVYIFADDDTGKQVASILCQAAQRGVKIRVLVDGIGTMSWGGEMTKALENAGVKTRIYHPLPWKIFHWARSNYAPNPILTKFSYLFSKINSRNHRKITLIDNQIVYIGSANICNSLSLDAPSNQQWRETTVKLVGLNLDELKFSFEKVWSRNPFKRRFKNIFGYGNPFSIFRLNYSLRQRRIFYRSLINNIMKSKTRIWVTNSYFVLDHYFLKKLIKASQRGVDVKILLPQKCDILISSLAAATFYEVLLKNGVKVYEFVPRILHAKILIIDDWYLIGSTNLNYRSFKHDLEVDVNIKSKEAKEIIDAQFQEDLQQSHELKMADLAKKPFYKKILGRIILLARNFI